jgi:V/A-type H+-transporting ATPase subunit I
MIVEMSRVEIIGLKKYLDKAISTLHRFGKMQIDDIREVPDLMIQPFSPTEKMRTEREEMDLRIANISGLIETFSKIIKGKGKPEIVAGDISSYQITENVVDITSQIQYLNNRKKTLQDELITFSKYMEMLKIITPFIPEDTKNSGNATIRALIHSSQTFTMTLLANQLKLLTNGKFEMITARVGDETNAVIGIFPLELVSQVEGFMKNERVTELILPEEYAYLSTEEALDHIEDRVRLDHEELDQIDMRLQRMAEEWLPKLQFWQLICRDRIDELETFLKSGETDYTFTIFGWIPDEDYLSLEELITSNFRENITVRKIDIPAEMRGRIPVKTKNASLVEPFEHFVKMRATPNYSDIDPSTLVSVFMPIFFGMMAGDVGYGIVMLLLAIIGGKRAKEGLLSDILKFLKFGAIWTIFFGVLFGEYFGSLGELIGIPPLWISRSASTSIFPLLIMTVSVGVGHILFGLLIGAWNAFINKSKSHFLERIGMFVGVVGLLFLVGGMTSALPGGFRLAGWVTLAVGLVLLSVSMGTSGIFLGPIEFVGLLGSILSYLRIAALGLASVFLAEVANELGGTIPSLLLGLLIAVLIHTLNIAMGILSPTIQSLRLQYVEFFQRFFQGGQSPFLPFKKRVN